MSIQELSVTGFRSLTDITWRPGTLNVIIGPNGSGKSNLLRVLEMTSLSAQGRLAKYVQSEGGFDALLWDGRAQRSIRMISTQFRRGMPGAGHISKNS